MQEYNSRSKPLVFIFCLCSFPFVPMVALHRRIHVFSPWVSISLCCHNDAAQTNLSSFCKMQFRNGMKYRESTERKWKTHRKDVIAHGIRFSPYEDNRSRTHQHNGRGYESRNKTLQACRQCLIALGFTWITFLGIMLSCSPSNPGLTETGRFQNRRCQANSVLYRSI